MKQHRAAVPGVLQVHLHGSVASRLSESDTGQRVFGVASAMTDGRVRQNHVRKAANTPLHPVGDAKDPVKAVDDGYRSGEEEDEA